MARPSMKKCRARTPDAGGPNLPCGEPCSVCAPATLARVLATLRSTPGNAYFVRDQWLQMREAHDVTASVTHALSATGEHYVTLTWWREREAAGFLAAGLAVRTTDGNDERQYQVSAYGVTSLEALAAVLSRPGAWAHGKAKQ